MNAWAYSVLIWCGVSYLGLIVFMGWIIAQCCNMLSE